MLLLFVSAGTSSGAFKAKVEAIYRMHNPDKLSEVPKILAKYANTPELLLRRLEHRYPPPVEKHQEQQDILRTESNSAQEAIQTMFGAVDSEVLRRQDAGNVVDALRLLQDGKAERNNSQLSLLGILTDLLRWYHS
jgi:hypothetical protein